MPMITPIAYPEFNGHRFSRSSTDLRIDTLKLPGWKGLSIDKELTPGETYGNSAEVQGTTRGKAKYSGEIELYLEESEVVKNYLALKGKPLGMGYMEVQFTVQLTIFELARGTILIEGIGCRITKDGLAATDSDDQLTKKYSLHVKRVRDNGVSAVIDRFSPF